MAKIAAAPDVTLLRQRGSFAAGRPAARVLTQGDGWSVDELVCASGPRDRPFEERHECFRIAIVASGTFQYRSAMGRELMTPGSILLGNAGQCFECGHAHGVGDRCLSFGYAPEYFEKLAAETGIAASRLEFRTLRLPPLRWLSPLTARACASLTHARKRPDEVPWEELNIQLAARTLELANGISPNFIRAPGGGSAGDAHR